MGLSIPTLLSKDRGRPRPHPATPRLLRTGRVDRRSLGGAGPHGASRLLDRWSACAKLTLRFGRVGRGRPRSMNAGVRLREGLSKFPVIPSCEGKSSHADRAARPMFFFPRPHPASREARFRRTKRLIPRRVGEASFLLSPVMIFLRPWFARRFREITGEIFFRAFAARRLARTEIRRAKKPCSERSSD
jgi:hypothetical protein